MLASVLEEETNEAIRLFIDRHMADDPARARAEYFAEFRVDVETFISREVVDRFSHNTRNKFNERISIRQRRTNPDSPPQ